MRGTNFEERAQEYIAGALPHGTAYEKQKLLEDWFGKEEAAHGIYDDFAKRAGNPVGAAVLDIGFGNGITASVFAERGAHVSGLEVSPELLSFAKDYLKSKNISADLALYEGNLFPFDDGTFDYIYSVSVLEHVSDSGAVMKEAYRVLKPGGRFYLAFPNRWNPKETHTGLWFLSCLPRKTYQVFISFFKAKS